MFSVQLDQECSGKKNAKPFQNETLVTLSLVFTCLQYKSFENTEGKGEIARNEQFFLFPQRFLLFCRTFHQNLRLSPANCTGLEESKYFCFGKDQFCNER